MGKDIDLKAIKTKLTVLLPKAARHFSFAAVMIILLVYIFTVWRVSQLATAEPSADEQTTADVVSVPNVDQKAIDQVLKLENNNAQIHALFNHARTNPFGE